MQVHELGAIKKNMTILYDYAQNVNNKKTGPHQTFLKGLYRYSFVQKLKLNNTKFFKRGSKYFQKEKLVNATSNHQQ